MAAAEQAQTAAVEEVEDQRTVAEAAVDSDPRVHRQGAVVEEHREPLPRVTDAVVARGQRLAIASTEEHRRCRAALRDFPRRFRCRDEVSKPMGRDWTGAVCRIFPKVHGRHHPKRPTGAGRGLGSRRLSLRMRFDALAPEYPRPGSLSSGCPDRCLAHRHGHQYGEDRASLHQVFCPDNRAPCVQHCHRHDR